MAVRATRELQELFSRAHQHQQAGRHAEAIPLYLELAPHVDGANVACNLARCFMEVGDLGEAQRWLAIARERRPDDRPVLEASLHLGALLMIEGRFAEAWPLLEARIPLLLQTRGPLQLSFPEWRGERLAGRSILVWVEQGFGDQIMFARFARLLAERGAAVSLACRPPLADLFRAMPDVASVLAVPRGELVSVPRHDYWSRYFSLPQHLDITLETLPREPYLTAPADRRATWAGRSGIGLFWKPSATGFNAAAKILPDDQARRLLDLGATSLHPEDTGAADFADTAAILAQLDLVISVDTAVAHLAGAMGVPCWTLLPAEGLDWRWMRDRDDTPWYPTMRLFRRSPADTWADVVDRVIAGHEAGAWRAWPPAGATSPPSA